MPRQSAAAAAFDITELAAPKTLRPRKEAPEAVQAIFLEIVASCPRDHFAEADGPLLESYAQAIIVSRQAYAELNRGGHVVDGKASPWLVVAEKADRAMVALSGRLRLSPQGRMESRAAGRKAARGGQPSAYQLGLHT